MNYYINENGALCQISDQSLMHYGVKGMKWDRRKKIDYAGEGVVSRQKKRQPIGGINPNAGKTTLGTGATASKMGGDISKGVSQVRKLISKANHSPTSKTKEQYIADKTRGIQRDIDSFAPHRKTGIRAKNGKLLMDTKEIDGIVAGLEKEKSKTAAKAAKKYDKAVRKDAIKSTARDLNKKATLGEKLTYNDATRRKAAKYIVDNKMSVDDAMKKAKGDAWRNTAAFMGIYAGITVASLYANR